MSRRLRQPRYLFRFDPVVSKSHAKLPTEARRVKAPRLDSETRNPPR